MMRPLFALVLVSLVGCEQPPVAREVSNNPNIPVDTLFTKDGCTVYRFNDGKYHYFAKCEGAVPATTMTTQSCGKNCSAPVEIPTVPSGKPFGAR